MLYSYVNHASCVIVRLCANLCLCMDECLMACAAEIAVFVVVILVVVSVLLATAYGHFSYMFYGYDVYASLIIVRLCMYFVYVLCTCEYIYE